MLPKAVEEQARRAEDLHRQHYGNTDEPAPEVEAKAPEPVEAPKEQAAPEPDDASFKRKWEVLSGKYSAEVPRLAAEIRELKEKLALAESQASAAPPKPSKLKPEEITEYGEEFTDFVKRAAAEVVPEDVGNIKAQVDQLREETARFKRDRFYSELAARAPHWERTNEDKEFLTWLSGIDPFSGRVRQEVFDEAVNSNDSWRVANFFNAFGGEQRAEPADASVLEPMVEPQTTRVSAPPPGKKIWTTNEINQFFADRRRGLYSPADADRIDQELFAAGREGRIRQR